MSLHNDHNIEIRLEPLESSHYGRLHCCDCNKFVQWLSKDDLESLTGEPVEEKEIWLNVPYDDGYLAKQLGAKWNPYKKKWYIARTMDVELFEMWIQKEA
jgi:hypothetical protein